MSLFKLPLSQALSIFQRPLNRSIVPCQTPGPSPPLTSAFVCLSARTCSVLQIHSSPDLPALDCLHQGLSAHTPLIHCVFLGDFEFLRMETDVCDFSSLSTSRESGLFTAAPQLLRTRPCGCRKASALQRHLNHFCDWLGWWSQGLGSGLGSGLGRDGHFRQPVNLFLLPQENVSERRKGRNIKNSPPQQ